MVKFLFSKKATKIDEIFSVDLTFCSKCQIGGADFVNVCGTNFNNKAPSDLFLIHGYIVNLKS